jgi:medium-chain acyl-[acyl-carrier-protein] hydrolase
MSETGGPIYTKDEVVRYHDCGEDHRLSLPSALRFFEEIALLQSEDLGRGFDYYAVNRVTWVLSLWDVRIRSLPRFRDRITVVTQPTVYRGFRADRRFAIDTAEGIRHLDALSRWIFLDTERMRPRRVPEEIISAFEMPAAAKTMPWDGEIGEFEGGEPGSPIVVRPDDLDYNGHVNNIRYVEWALDAVPPGTGDLSRLLVSYEGETVEGAKIRIVTRRDGNTVRQRVVEGDRTAALVETRWEALPQS